MIDLNDWYCKNFTHEEVMCKCGCGLSNFEFETIDKFQKAREWLGRPIYFISGCRCKHNNRLAGGTKDSSHLCSRTKKAHAGDVTLVKPSLHRPMTSNERFLLVHALMEAGFRRLGIKEESVHADTNKTKRRRVMWLY